MRGWVGEGQESCLLQAEERNRETGWAAPLKGGAWRAELRGVSAGTSGRLETLHRKYQVRGSGAAEASPLWAATRRRGEMATAGGRGSF